MLELVQASQFALAESKLAQTAAELVAVNATHSSQLADHASRVKELEHSLEAATQAALDAERDSAETRHATKLAQTAEALEHSQRMNAIKSQFEREMKRVRATFFCV